MKPKITPEIARIHAHVCGDGCVYISKWHRSPADLKSHPRRKTIRYMWEIAYCNTCPELIREFITDFKTAFNRKSTYYPKKYDVRIKGAKHIVEKLELKTANSYEWYIPKFIIGASRKIIANWLRAFFDDEGTVSIQKKRVRIKSVSRRGLVQVEALLLRLGIQSRITGPNIDNSWYINIYKTHVGRYEEKIGFLHPEKRIKLKKLMGQEGISAPLKRLRQQCY